MRLVYDSEALKSKAGQCNAPALMFNDEKRLSNWKDILMLAERMSCCQRMMRNMRWFSNCPATSAQCAMDSAMRVAF